MSYWRYLVDHNRPNLWNWSQYINVYPTLYMTHVGGLFFKFVNFLNLFHFFDTSIHTQNYLQANISLNFGFKSNFMRSFNLTYTLIVYIKGNWTKHNIYCNKISLDSMTLVIVFVAYTELCALQYLSSFWKCMCVWQLLNCGIFCL